MKQFSILLLFYLFALGCKAQSSYVPLDVADPVSFDGHIVTYGGKQIKLGPMALYVDCLLDDKAVAQNPYVFNSFNEAMKHLTPGSEMNPMTVYIAPGVYWIDDPDDPAVRYPKAGDSCPFAIEIHGSWLKLQGLTCNPRNVVLAVARGQSQGSYGNFTMMKYVGDGLSINDMTLGNFCNIDLEYPLKPEWGRKRRMDAITQAQLVFAYGDKHVCRNVHFLSRLNLGVFWCARRTLFDHCYFEMTDDSMGDSGVYLDCKMKFFSSMPWGGTQRFGGTVLLNCDLYSLCKEQQFISKTNRGPASLIDVRYHCRHTPYLGWVPERDTNLRFYQSNVTLNGQQVLLEQKDRALTNDISCKRVLDAYRIVDGKDTIYNTYNLLCGDDDWDPMHVKSCLMVLEKKLGRRLLHLPIHLMLQSDKDTLTANQAAATLSATLYRMSGYRDSVQPLIWEYDHNLLEMEGGNSQKSVRSISRMDSACSTWVRIHTDDGLVAAYRLVVRPQEMPAPSFKAKPSLETDGRGLMTLKYRLNLPDKRSDCSEIRWYRCTSIHGDNPVLVKVSHNRRLQLSYQLTANDRGYYIMATVAPKHQTSQKGKAERAIACAQQIPDVDYGYETDFTDFPTEQQTLVKSGFWTVDGYHPKDIAYYKWNADTLSNWYYGTIRGESGLLQSNRGARLMFTPVLGAYTDMKVNLQIASFKSGQGFGSATGQYMDICIKFDTRTLTGYALRIIRTTKYADAVDFYFVKYNRGNIEQISEAVTTICYRTPCYIQVENHGRQLSATARTDCPLDELDTRAHTIDITAQMDDYTSLGGFAIQHTGSGYGNSSCLQHLSINWK